MASDKAQGDKPVRAELFFAAESLLSKLLMLTRVQLLVLLPANQHTNHQPQREWQEVLQLLLPFVWEDRVISSIAAVSQHFRQACKTHVKNNTGKLLAAAIKKLQQHWHEVGKRQHRPTASAHPLNSTGAGQHCSTALAAAQCAGHSFMLCTKLSYMLSML